MNNRYDLTPPKSQFAVHKQKGLFLIFLIASLLIILFSYQDKYERESKYNVLRDYELCFNSVCLLISGNYRECLQLDEPGVCNIRVVKEIYANNPMVSRIEIDPLNKKCGGFR
jgi:hypothetical protein